MCSSMGKIPNAANKGTYKRFVEWTAVPPSFRAEDERLKSQLALKLGISESTLFSWQNQPQFWTDVVEAAKRKLPHKSQEVTNALIEKALSGDVQAIKLFFQKVEGWSEKLETKVSGSINIVDYLAARKALKDKQK